MISRTLDDKLEERRARWTATYSVEAIEEALMIFQIVVKHDEFEHGMQVMNRVFSLSGNPHFPVGARLIGATGLGKSKLVNQFESNLPRNGGLDGFNGVIRLSLVKHARLAEVVRPILAACGYPGFKISDKALPIKRDISIEAMKRVGVRAVIVDEAHHCITKVSLTNGEGSALSNYFQQMMDEAHVGLVLVGNQLLEKLSDADPSLARRCSAKVSLSEFGYGENWFGFVSTLVDLIPHMQANFLDGSNAWRKALWSLCRGNPGRLCLLLVELSMVCHDAGCLQPNQIQLQLATDRAFGSDVPAGWRLP